MFEIKVSLEHLVVYMVPQKEIIPWKELLIDAGGSNVLSR
jgi:hypothetical protein